MNIYTTTALSLVLSLGLIQAQAMTDDQSTRPGARVNTSSKHLSLQDEISALVSADSTILL